MKEDIDRFWSKVDIRGENECWEWTGHRHVRGYGIFWFNGKNVRANRFALMLTEGEPSGPDLMALHSCDNTPCCNPKHLRWGTAQDNVDDMILRQGRRVGENAVGATINDDIASRIYTLRLDGYLCREIAEQIGISKTIVEQVISGRTWGHLLGVNGNPTLEELRKPRKMRTKRVSANRKLSDEVVDKILALRMSGMKLDEIVEAVGHKRGTISPVISGHAFTHRLGVDGNPTLEQLKSVRTVSNNLKLTEDDIQEIKSLLAQGYWGADIAIKYGVSRGTISNIKNGKYRHS